jgi:hypothetical protein
MLNSRTLFVPLALASALTVLACGGGFSDAGSGGGGGGGTGIGGYPTSFGSATAPADLSKKTTITGKVVWPATLVTEGGRLTGTYRVVSGLAKATVAGDGTFSLVVPTGARSITYLQNAGGETVMMARLGVSNTQISADSTADALGYLASGGFMLPYEVLPEFEKALSADQNVKALAPIIASKVAGGKTLAQYRPDLSTVIGQIATSYRNRSIDVTPGSATDGIKIDTSADPKVTMSNSFHRPLLVWVDKVAQRATADAGYTPVGPESVVNRTVVKASYSYSGSPGTYINAATGSYAFDPVAGPPFSAKVDAPNYSTQYAVWVVGPGTQAGDFAQLSSDRQAEYNRLALKSLLCDEVIQMVGRQIGGASWGAVNLHYDNFILQESQPTGSSSVGVDSGQLDAACDAIAAANPAVVDAFNKSLFTEAAQMVFQTAVTNSSVEEALRAVVNGLYFKYTSGGTETIPTDRFHVYMIENAKAGVYELGKSVIDQQNVMYGILGSRRARRFFVESKKENVKIVSDKEAATSTETAKLTTTTTETVPVQYVYTVSGYGGVKDSKGGTAVGYTPGTLTSDDSVVTFDAGLYPGVGTSIVFVDVIDKSTKKKVGSSQVEVATLPDVNLFLAPFTTQLDNGQQESFKAFVPNLGTLPDGVQLAYAWHVGPLCKGDFVNDDKNVFSRVKLVAGSGKGTETLTCTLFYYLEKTKTYRKAAQSSATVICNEPNKKLFPAGMTIVNSYSTDGTYNYRTMASVIRVPKKAGAKSYAIRGTGGYDFAYFGAVVEPGQMSPTDIRAYGGDPDTEVWFGLGSASGNAQGDWGAYETYYHNRYDAFRFVLTVTF